MQLNTHAIVLRHALKTVNSAEVDEYEAQRSSAPRAARVTTRLSAPSDNSAATRGPPPTREANGELPGRRTRRVARGGGESTWDEALEPSWARRASSARAAAAR